jgi:hypothetical protein
VGDSSRVFRADDRTLEYRMRQAIGALIVTVSARPRERGLKPERGAASAVRRSAA